MYPDYLDENYPQNTWTHTNIFSNNKFDFIRAFIHHSYYIGMHSHDFYEINIVINGIGAHYIENQMFEIGRGDIFVIPPGVRHGYYQKSNLDVYHILVSHLFFDRYLNELEQLPRYFALFNVEPLIRMNINERLFMNLNDVEFNKFYILLEQLLNICTNDSFEKEIMKNSFTLYTIAEMCRYYRLYNSLQDKTNTNQNYLLFIKSMDIIYLEYDKKITIDKLAKSINMSRSAYIKTFKKILNCSPGEFISNFRISKAKTMLLQTEFSITEIALQTGFYDSSHFIRTFMKAEGITPSQFVKKNVDCR